jgi:hypothetical protein
MCSSHDRRALDRTGTAHRAHQISGLCKRRTSRKRLFERTATIADQDVLQRPLGKGFSLDSLLSEIEQRKRTRVSTAMR